MSNSGVYPRFRLDSVQDDAATEREGRPICRDVERVEIHIAGNSYTKHVMNVNNEHRQRWQKEYEAFKAGIEMSPDGTPLEQWSILKPSQVQELKGLGFKTVEHVRDMDDNAVQRIRMGGRKLKELAGAFLDDAENMALASRLSADNDRKDAEIAALKNQVTQMGELMERNFAELRARQDAPNPLSVMIPGMSDPVEQTRQSQSQEYVGSSLDNIAPRRRGRPPKEKAA